MLGRGFASDNASGCHPAVLDALKGANQGHVVAYGDDPITQACEGVFRQHFGEQALVFPVLTGTGANVLSLSAMLAPFESVVCSDEAHLHVDECGAPERFVGSKLMTVPADEKGKITPEQVAKVIDMRGDEHQVQPKVISLTQATELGTLYTLEELTAFADFAHERDMYLHVDGARICNAAVALNSSFQSLITDTGVDVLSFGGTKNGLITGEAVVFLNPELGRHFKFYRKQAMQLLSKMRFVSAQLYALLKDDLWYQNAANANRMAHYFGQQLQGVEGVELVAPVETNAVFARMPLEWIPQMQEHTYFYVWHHDVVRLMCSFDTRVSDIDAFISHMETLA